MREIIIPALRRRGVPVCVLDPLQQRWGADWQTDDPMLFVRRARVSRGCVWVIDEFPHFAKNHDYLMELEWLFTIARNYGHLSYAMAQRLMQIPPNVRNQCSNAIVFRQAKRDLWDLAEIMDNPSIVGARDLPQGTGLMCQPFKNPVTIRVF